MKNNQQIINEPVTKYHLDLAKDYFSHFKQDAALCVREHVDLRYSSEWRTGICWSKYTSRKHTAKLYNFLT